ncbi:GNAT family N-acetyltransferase [Oerskovia turbata]
MNIAGDIRWVSTWENDLHRGDHRQISDMLSASFPAASAWFLEGRSWAASRPERRLRGFLGDQLVAHAGFLRRFVRVGGVSQLVGEVGILAVHDDMRGLGVGQAIVDQLHRSLKELEVPFGYFNCRQGMVDFYSRGGWVALPESTRTRMPTYMEPFDPPTTGYPAMFLPVLAAASEWPAGEFIDRDGFET